MIDLGFGFLLIVRTERIVTTHRLHHVLPVNEYRRILGCSSI